MNRIIAICIAAFLAGCGSSEAEDTEPVKTETKENLKEVQDLNVELEEIDGELDSLINNLE